MFDWLATAPQLAPPDPGVLMQYGPVGAFAVVLLVVLSANYKMNSEARKGDAERLKEQLSLIKDIATAQRETATALTATMQGLALATQRLDDIARDLKETAR